MDWNHNGDEYCTAIPCVAKHTHVLTTKVVATKDFGEMIKETNYCLDHALYFAAWLPYCYPGEYELVSITPPAKELFK